MEYESSASYSYLFKSLQKRNVVSYLFQKNTENFLGSNKRNGAEEEVLRDSHFFVVTKTIEKQ